MAKTLNNNDLDLQGRIKRVCFALKETGKVESIADLSLKLGYKHKMSLYQVLNGTTPIPRFFIDNITRTFPCLNEKYITEGVGDLFVAEPEPQEAQYRMISEADFGKNIDMFNAIIKDYQERLNVRDKQIDRLITLVEATSGIKNEQTEELKKAE